MAEYNKAIELSPNLTLAYSNRAQAYEALGRVGPAIDDYNKVLELDPNDAARRPCSGSDPTFAG